MTEVRALELFCCAGGMSEGFRRAGAPATYVVDWDADACASYEANLGHRPLRLDVHEVARTGELMPGVRLEWLGLDLIVADPPCTPWSVAGKRRGLDDPRDCLQATVAIILRARPRAYLIGNVPGLDHAPNLPALRRVLEPLRAAGYCIADYARFNAADHGVPQIRWRPFWFGHLDGPCLRWPAPSHCDPALLGHPALFAEHRQPWVTCAEALGHLPLAELGRPVQLRRRAGALRGNRPDMPAYTITGKDGRHDSLLLHPKHPVCELDRPARTVTARARGGQGSCILSLERNRQAAAAWPWDRPATTVTTRECLGAPGHHGAGGQFGAGAIRLGETARLILQGFPQDWVVRGEHKASRNRQIGMAMPPPLAEAVAGAIVQWWGRV